MLLAAPAAAALLLQLLLNHRFPSHLTEAPADKKIGVIKVVREITGLGLKEAKILSIAAPKVLKETCSKS